MLESKTVSSMDAGMHVPNHVDLRIVTESGKQNKKKKDNLSSNVTCPDYCYYFSDCKTVIAAYAHMLIAVGPR